MLGRYIDRVWLIPYNSSSKLLSFYKVPLEKHRQRENSEVKLGRVHSQNVNTTHTLSEQISPLTSVNCPLPFYLGYLDKLTAGRQFQNIYFFPFFQIRNKQGHVAKGIKFLEPFTKGNAVKLHFKQFFRYWLPKLDFPSVGGY